MGRTYWKIEDRGISSGQEFSSLSDVKRYIAQFCNKREAFDGCIVNKIEDGEIMDYRIVYISEYGSRIILFDSEMEYDAHKAEMASEY